MMTFGTGSFGWLGLLIWLAFIAGIVLVVVWAVGAAGRGSDEEPLRELRSRFARGDIDAAQLEEMRRVLGASERPRTGARLGLLGLLLIGGALVAGVLLSWVGPYGWGSMTSSGGMMWPGMGPIMGVGSAPTAPAGTSVRMAGTRFEPSTLTIRVGETVRWFNDDALPHTVSATDGSWDSGNLPPGASFERRFDTVGSYPYLCRYHPGMVATIKVQSP
jgi:plastocyanin